MRSMLDSEFDDMHGVDVLRGLESFCLEADTRDASEAENVTHCDGVWLECSGELRDVGSVKSWDFTNQRAASRRCSSSARSAGSVTNRFALGNAG